MSTDASKFTVPDAQTKQMISFPYSQGQKEYFKWIQKTEICDDSAKFKIPESPGNIPVCQKEISQIEENTPEQE